MVTELAAWREARATAKVLSAEAGIILVEYRGLVSARTWESVANVVKEVARKHWFEGIVARCDTALVLVTPDEIPGLVKLFSKRLDRAVPGAIVCNPGQAELFRAYAWGLAHHGIRRHIVTDVASALSWVRERVPEVHPAARFEFEHPAGSLRRQGLPGG